MKKIIKSLLTILIAVSITSCEDESNFRYVNEAADFAITSPTSGSVVLDVEYATNPGITLTWEAANFGSQTPVDYTVEMAKAGTNFETITAATSTTNTFVTLTIEELNGVAVGAGLEPFSEGGLEVRIKATIGTQASLTKYSNVITYLVTPYSTDLPRLYVTGNFLSNSGYGNNWTPANGVPIAASAFGQTNYEGFVYINEPSYAFLFLPTNSSFDNKYGDDGSFSGTLAANGSDIVGTGANYYYVKANTTTLTYSLQPANWAITGAATPLGWPDNGVQDQNMTYNPTTKKWEITIALTAGGNQFKFRANDSWDLNLGKDGGDADTSMDFGGDNLDVPAAGTYKVELDLSNPRNYSWTATLQ